MRETHTAQRSIFQTATDHEIAYELKRMSDWLDGHPELLDLIAADLQCSGGSSCGRRGMTLESVLRCAILMTMLGSIDSDRLRPILTLRTASLS